MKAINKAYEMTASDIGYDDDSFEISMTFSIYSDYERKTHALNRIGLFSEHAEIGVLSVDKPLATLYGVFVEENARGNGLGSELIQEFIQKIKEHDAIGILEVDPSDSLFLVNFYTELGFVDIKLTDLFDQNLAFNNVSTTMVYI